MLYIKIALIAGLLLASPAVFTQVWLFVAPGLYAHEKKWAIPFVVMSSFFFIVGAAFSHYVVFPITWRFFVGFTSDIVTFMPRIEPAFSIYLRLILALGITFQLPTLVLFLARMGMITPRFMIRNFKYAVLLIIIAAAVLSPDGGGVGLIAMGGPVILLYVFSIGLAWRSARRSADATSWRAAPSIPARHRDTQRRFSSARTLQLDARVNTPWRTRRARCRPPHFRHFLPVGGRLSNGMLRIVACVSALIAASHAAEPHHGETTKPGRPSMICLNSS